MSIPKIIHFCWFGKSALPKSALKCIESWKKFFPDYEIKRWDETNFDVNRITYTREAYAAKKYAFVSDYARFYILYNYGGLYFDTDVEVIKSFDDILAYGGFMGCESRYFPNQPSGSLNVAPGLGLAVSSHNPLYKKIINIYENLKFINSDGSYNCKTVVKYVTEILCERGLKNTDQIQCIDDINIYPIDYFCPISTIDGKLRITSETHSIHWYDQSWQNPIRKYGRKLVLFIGNPWLKKLIKILIFKN